MYELHNGRITSTVFGEIMSRRDDTSPTAITKHLMGYNKNDRLATLPQLKWGREKESVVRIDEVFWSYTSRMFAIWPYTYANQFLPI